jgi:hypothetical protein
VKSTREPNNQTETRQAGRLAPLLYMEWRLSVSRSMGQRLGPQRKPSIWPCPSLLNYFLQCCIANPENTALAIELDSGQEVGVPVKDPLFDLWGCNTSSGTYLRSGSTNQQQLSWNQNSTFRPKPCEDETPPDHGKAWLAAVASAAKIESQVMANRESRLRWPCKRGYFRRAAAAEPPGLRPPCPHLGWLER